MSEEYYRAAAAAYDYDDENIMSDSANALTKKLYLTVMDVFGSYAANGNDDEYAKMIENLRKKQMKDTTKVSSPVKSDDNRGIIAKRLLEGWVLSGDYCEECAIPMMAYDGELSCVVCKKSGEIDDVTKSFSESVLALQSTTASDLDEEEEKEVRVNKELSEFRERRTQSTQAYTTKLLSGYTMHDEQCSKCDMPMMKINDTVECIFCPEEEEDSESDVEEEEDAPVEEAQKPLKELSQAELMIERLRGAKPKSSKEDVENEIEKAEDELLKILETLGLQGNQNGETIREFISKKKEARAIEKQIKKTSDVIVEAEVVSDPDGVKIASEQGKDFKSGAPMKVMVDGVPAVAYRIAPPVTPKLDSSINCRLGDSIFPSLKNLFASASPPIVDDMCTNPYAAPNPHYTGANPMSVPNPRDTSRIEAKQRISMLVMAGWEVSAHECPQCSLPLFTNSHGQTLQIEGLKRCVMCGPIAQDAPKRSMQDDIRSRIREETQEELNLKMVNKVKEEMDKIETMQSKLNALAMSVANIATTQDSMQNKKLEVDVPASSEAIVVLPDPTTSMYDHRHRVDPPREETLMLTMSQAAPTPRVTFADEPTPNNARFNESSNLPTYEQLLAMYKQQGKLNASQPMHAVVDPTPSNYKFISNMKAMEAPGNK